MKLKKLFFSVTLSIISVNMFSMESTSKTEEKFPWENLPVELRYKVMRDHPWHLDTEHSLESVLKSFREYQDAYNNAYKLRDRDLLLNITNSYKTFIQNILSEADFKKLNQYVLDSLYKVQLSEEDLILLTRLLIWLNKLDTTTIDRTLNIAFMTASKDNDTDTAELLIKAGTNINAVDSDGNTALMEASLNGHKEMAELLIKAGADVNLPQESGKNTALIKASWNGHKDVAELLIKAGANINTGDFAGWTPLMIASLYGHKNLVELLIKHGANVDAADRNGTTALMGASGKGHKYIAELLIEAGANVNTTNDNGKTALMKAAENNNTDIAELLKKHGAE